MLLLPLLLLLLLLLLRLLLLLPLLLLPAAALRWCPARILYGVRGAHLFVGPLSLLLRAPLGSLAVACWLLCGPLLG